MKRTFIGLAAVTLAIWLSSFHLRQDAKFGQYYWFHLQSTGWPSPSQFLVYQQGVPDYCGNFGLTPYCDGGFTGYYGTGPYYASGIEIYITHNYPNNPPR